MTADLFDTSDPHDGHDAPAQHLRLSEHAVLLRGHALALAPALWQDVQRIAHAASWRHMQTPGGKSMAVATTSCGALGWISDRRGYRYVGIDPLTGLPWPPMPPVWLQLAQLAAAEAGFEGFTPDSCLINRYAAGTRLSLHQDRDEHDLTAPIVSVSLGLPATFLWGGAARGDRTQRVPLSHGDVLVWGGADRLRFHGVMPVQQATHLVTGDYRVNLTFRKAG